MKLEGLKGKVYFIHKDLGSLFTSHKGWSRKVFHSFRVFSTLPFLLTHLQLEVQGQETMQIVFACHCMVYMTYLHFFFCCYVSVMKLLLCTLQFTIETENWERQLTLRQRVFREDALPSVSRWKIFPWKGNRWQHDLQDGLYPWVL